MQQTEKLKALDAALTKIEKDYGKGAVMKLGEYQADMSIETTPTGFSEPGYRSRSRRYTEGKGDRDLRSGVKR